MVIRSLVFVLGAILCLAWGFASAQGWIFGPVPDFDYSGFDGEYYPPTGKVYFLGGRMQNGGTGGRIWSYDPMAGTFTDEQVDMEVPVSDFNVGLLNDPAGPDSLALYVAGGRRGNGTNLAALQVYYPISGLAMSIASDPYPGRIAGKVALPGHGQVVCNNKLYVFGGLNVSSPPPYNADSTYVYDPSLPAGSRWTAIPTALLSLPRGDITPAVVDGKIYAIGGAFFDGTLLHPTNLVERFDPADPGAGWVRMADITDSLMASQAFGFDTGSPYGFGGHIIVAGNNGSSFCYDYNTHTNTWALFPSLNWGRRNHAGCFIPGTAGRNGVPGMWVFGGGSASDTIPDTTSEYWWYQWGAEEQGVVKQNPDRIAMRTFPNPARSGAVISFSVPYSLPSTPYTLSLFDLSGRRVKSFPPNTLRLTPHEVVWDGRDDKCKPVSSGVYFVRLEAGSVALTRRLVLAR
jgi:hypothetical protein